jgi:MAPEG family
MSLKMFGTSLAVGILGSVVESKYLSKCVVEFGQGATPFILVGTGFWAMMHGFKVGEARKKYMALAKADGEVDAETRYDLPNMYVDGKSKHAKAFNCVQRSHQHIFETFGQLCTSSLIAWMSYPIASAVTTLSYSIGRYYLSTDYAKCEGEPSKRYSNQLAMLTWYGLLSTSVLGALSAMKMSLKGKMW